MGLLLLALCFNKNMLPVVVGYVGFIIYQNTLFDDHSPVINHVIYGVIFFGRMFTGIRGKKAAQGAILGFVMVVLTYFLHV